MVVLELLGEAGWRAGREKSDPHTAEQADDRRLCLLPGYVASPLYYVCLLKFQDLLVGGLRRLFPGQKQECYKRLLANPALELAPNLPAAQYRLLGDRGAAAPPLADLPGVASPIAMPDGDEVDEFAVVDDDGPAVSPRAVAPARSSTATVPAQPSVVGAPRVSTSARALPEVMFTDDAVVVDVGSTAVPASPWLDLLQQAAAPSLPTSICGQAVRLESRMEASHGPGYVRKQVLCPYHGDSCSKRRNCNLAEGGDQLTVLACLKAWLVAGPRFDSKAAHVAYKPTRAEIQSCLDDMS